MEFIEKKLGEICNVRRGSTITKKQTILGDIPVIGGGVKPTYYHNKPNRNGNTITVSASGASAGFVNFYKEPIFASDCSTIESENNEADIRYIYYAMVSLQDYIFSKLKVGAAQPHVYAKDISNLKIILPSIKDQNKIVKLFDKINDIKKKQEINLKKLDRLVENFFKKKFTISNNIRNEEKNLGDVCDFVRGPFGGSLKKDFFKKSGYAVYEQNHAINNHFEDIRYFIDEKKFNEMKRFELQSGDLIMSCSGTMGKVAIVPKNFRKGIINQALLKLTPKSKLDKTYLKYYLDTDLFQDKLSKETHGAAIKNVASVAVLKKIKILIPAISEQKSFINFLSKKDSINSKKKELMNLFYNLMGSLQKKYFGKILNEQ